MVFSKSADYGFRGAGSGFPQLVRETLSKNAMPPGLTYFYCNSVSQGEREALGCGVGKEGSNGVGCSAGPFWKREKGRTPSYFGLC
jgi:hypothetical protein